METLSDRFANSDYSEFLYACTEKGALKVRASLANGALPVEGMRVEVYKRFRDGRKVFFAGMTDSSGVSGDISLPAPPYIPPSEYDPAGACAVYSVIMSKSGFETIESAVRIFGRIKTVKLIAPKIAGGDI